MYGVNLKLRFALCIFVHVASELAPLAKVGGLADVLLGLSREQSWKGHDIDIIIIPKYDCMDSNEIRDMNINYPHLMSFYQEEWFSNTIWMGWVENLKVYFIRLLSKLQSRASACARASARPFPLKL